MMVMVMVMVMVIMIKIKRQLAQIEFCMRFNKFLGKKKLVFICAELTNRFSLDK